MYPPNAIHDQTELNWDGKPADLELHTYCGSIDYNFIDLYGIKIIKGRNFSEEYSSDAKGAFLINETAAKLLGWENPIGRELKHWSGEKGKIVGVMKDFNFSSLHLKIEPLYLFLDPHYRNYLLSININGSNLPETIKFIKEKFNAFYPKYPFKYEFLDEAFANTYKNEQDMGNSFIIFSLIAIFISCLGLLGLASYTAESRTKEIGIRKVMGAKISEISYQLIKDFLKWVLIANIIAWPVAYYFMNNWLQDFAYRTELTIWIFLISGVITLGIACTAVVYQAIRAASVNPIKSLRYE
jgi:putative ABC transport system permease protein